MKAFFSKLCVSLLLIILPTICVIAQVSKPVFNYTVSFPSPSEQSYHIELNTSGWNENTVQFKMPRWMPGYYQIMDYGKNVNNIFAIDNEENMLPLKQIDNSTWEISEVKGKSFKII